MNIALRTSRMTQEQFFDWAEAQEERYEFDGFEPVAMTGGSINHSRLTGTLQAVLRAQLKGSACRVLGPDAGVATVGNTVRYPDALITCTKVAGAERLVPGAVVVFEVLSPSSGYNDRIVKLSEYWAVSSIQRYVILESTGVGLTIHERAGLNWGTTVLTGGILAMPEVGIEVSVSELYDETDLLPGIPSERSSPA